MIKYAIDVPRTKESSSYADQRKWWPSSGFLGGKTLNCSRTVERGRCASWKWSTKEKSPLQQLPLAISLERMSFSSYRQDRDCSSSTAGGSEVLRRVVHGPSHPVWRWSERPNGEHHVPGRERWQRRNHLDRRRCSHSCKPIKEGNKKATPWTEAAPLERCVIIQ